MKCYLTERKYFVPLIIIIFIIICSELNKFKFIFCLFYKLTFGNVWFSGAVDVGKLDRNLPGDLSLLLLFPLLLLVLLHAVWLQIEFSLSKNWSLKSKLVRPLALEEKKNN